MDFNSTIDLIIKDLNEASGIIDDLKNYPGVPEFQVELAKAKCRSAGEVIALLKSIRHQPFVRTNDKTTGPGVKEATQEETKPPDQDISFQQPGPTVGKKPPARSIKISQDEEVPEKKAEKKITALKTETDKPESSIIADNFSNMSERINELLGTIKSEGDVSSRIKSKHINSLNAAIGINDRFLFIREIFDGNKDAYEQAIAKLELTDNEADARAVIISYTGSNRENESVRLLLDLVKRKLSPDE
jgi:hypothetical protein